jgi:hypothetical protein
MGISCQSDSCIFNNTYHFFVATHAFIFLFLDLFYKLCYWNYFIYSKKIFRQPNLIVGIISIIITFLGVGAIPLLGKNLGDKVDKVMEYKVR